MGGLRSHRNGTRGTEDDSGSCGSTNVNTSPLLASESSLEQFYQRDFTTAELRSNVEVQFPHGGGTVVRERGSHGHRHKYAVYAKTGELRRTLVVDKKGKVFEMSFEDDDESLGEEAGGAIRLGLVSVVYYMLHGIEFHDVRLH